MFSALTWLWAKPCASPVGCCTPARRHYIGSPRRRGRIAPRGKGRRAWSPSPCVPDTPTRRWKPGHSTNSFMILASRTKVRGVLDHQVLSSAEEGLAESAFAQLLGFASHEAAELAGAQKRHEVVLAEAPQDADFGCFRHSWGQRVLEVYRIETRQTLLEEVSLLPLRKPVEDHFGRVSRVGSLGPLLRRLTVLAGALGCARALARTLPPSPHPLPGRSRVVLVCR